MTYASNCVYCGKALPSTTRSKYCSKECIRKKLLDYYHAHQAETDASRKKSRFKLKVEILVHYGGNPPKCVCCGEATLEFLTLDHGNNDGAEMRRKIAGKSERLRGGYTAQFFLWLKRQGLPDNLGLQVLCWNCNCAKGHFGICPHKRNSEVWNSI